jgi:hypothetical protein
VPRTDATYEEGLSAPWLRAVVLPALLFVVAVAIVCALVLSGAVQGKKTYDAPKTAPTTSETVLIEP